MLGRGVQSMKQSRIAKLLFATVALAAGAAGAGGGRAATLALTRAVADTGQAVAEIKGDARLPALPTETRTPRTK